ncbi:MAG: transketolase [Bacteroidota bacterium]
MADPAVTSSPEEVKHLQTLVANTIRGLTLDAVEKADSGHPGLPMGMADAATVLWTEFLRHDPADPAWADRDRFVLSGGHGSMLLYSLLHLAGYEDMTMDQLKRFRQWGSRTAGHPEVELAPGIETTTGPLGQGIATAVGMAIAEKHLAAVFNTDDHAVVDHWTWVIASDGDLMEGVSNEACSLAGHLGLGKLIVLYDDNEVTIDGSTDLAFSEDPVARYEALGWHVLRGVDGHDKDAVRDALRTAKGVLDRPTLVNVRTTIGFGSPNKAGTSGAHSDAFGDEEVRLTKENLGIPLEPAFHVPDEAKKYMGRATCDRAEAHSAWKTRRDAWREANPDLAAKWDAMHSAAPPEGWADALPTFEADAKGMATRAASGKVLEAIFDDLPALMGGSADLTPSNKTKTSDAQNFSRAHPEGRYLRFGVREHGMGAILNGLTIHGGLRGFGGTFLVFSDYMKAAVRLSALMHTPVLWVYTHDSVGLGEDGPTHQPIEHLAALRSVPNLHLVRPADANETAEAWRLALERTAGPTAFAFTRQGVPTLDRSTYGSAEGTRRGAYVLADADGTPDVLLLATGSEVHLALEARDKLGANGIAARVVSMPCWEVFREQDQEYRDAVLPPSVRARVAVEAANPMGWHEWVGLDGTVIGLNRFGASAPYEEIYEHLGLTADAVAEAARALLER